MDIKFITLFITQRGVFGSKNKKPLKKRGFKGGPTCTQTNPLKY
jgi:hypothetical protein